MRTKLALFAAAAFAVKAITPASAAVTEVQLQQSYVYSSPYDLHHGLSYNTYASGSGTTNSYNVPAPGGVMIDGFPKSSFNPPLMTYFLGTSNLFDEVSTDGPAADGHLLIAFNDVFAGTLLGAGQDFTTTFSGFNEGDLIAALTLLDTPDLDPLDVGYAAQMAAKDNAFALIGSFSGTVDTMGGLTAANGGTFTLLSFSTPGPAGAGVALLTPIPGGVPEPATWLMMIAGFGAIGFALRSQRTTTVTFG